MVAEFSQLNNFEPHPDYDGLPESIKAMYTEKEYAWLGNFDRDRLLETETCPEPEDD